MTLETTKTGLSSSSSFSKRKIINLIALVLVVAFWFMWNHLSHTKQINEKLIPVQILRPSNTHETNDATPPPPIYTTITANLTPFDDQLQNDLPLTRTVISEATLARRTNRNSPMQKIYFIDKADSLFALGRPIPSFPPIEPPQIDFGLSAVRDEDGHLVDVIKTLEIEYSYANQIRDAMINITNDYPYMKYARANGCLFMLCRNSDLHHVLQSVRAVEFAFNHKYNYPWVLLNDVSFTEGFKRAVGNATNSKVEFGIIPKDHWSVPHNINETAFQESLDENGRRYIYGSSRPYRLMCRFNSRFVSKHPLMAKYRYYWRVEPDVDYRCLIRYDPFLYMALSGKRYGYVIAGKEFLETVEGLWKHTVTFMQNEALPLSPFLRSSFYDPEPNQYNGNHFWSNFEIADLEFYRSELYEHYMDALDRSGGFFYKRFGDAPVHSVAAAMLLQPNEIHHFSDISYYHEGHGTCPKTKNQTEFSDICWCHRSEGWIEHDWWAINLHTTAWTLLKYTASNDPWM